MPSIESYQMLLAAAAACDDKKAEDVRILALDPAESGLADYFLICNGTNNRQNVAITDEIELRLKRNFATYPNSVEGRRQGEWVLMDYVDFIVHVFSPEKRAYYGLERLRKSATSMSIDDLNGELKAAITMARDRKPVGIKRSSTAAAESTKKALNGANARGPNTDIPPPTTKSKRPATSKTATKKPLLRRATSSSEEKVAAKRPAKKAAKRPVQKPVPE